jgi:2-amino-4-hydroxy-6-hydroxymethyldihydropteridine diphosphokinase
VNRAPVRAFVALGGNLGDVAATFTGALAAMDELPGTAVRARSSLYRNPPLAAAGVDADAQPDYLNAVAMLDTTLDAGALLESMLSIERRFGRARIPGERWGPRTLDLDLLVYGEECIDAPGLCVPHPALHERAFVLVPLAQIAPGLAIPGRGPLQALLAAVDTSALEALP